jgi:hypothetical protein
VTALACWAAARAMEAATVDFARVVTMADLAGAADEAARCGALAELFAEAQQAGRAVLVLDDVDRMVAGHGADGASPAILGTLRALLRLPLARRPEASAGTTGPPAGAAPMMLVLATTSSGRAACTCLEGIFDATRVAPLVSDAADAELLLRSSPALGIHPASAAACAAAAVEGGALGVKTILNLASRAVSEVAWEDGLQGSSNKAARGRESSQGTSGQLDEGVGRRQEAAMARLVGEWRVQEEAASSSCVLY